LLFQQALLNVGPRADGSIPENQLKRLTDLGSWMKINSEAIYDTKPWKIPGAILADGTRVRFTQKKNSLFVILLDQSKTKTLFLPNISIPKESKVTQLAQRNISLKWNRKNDGIEIILNSSQDNFASVIKIDMQP